MPKPKNINQLREGFYEGLIILADLLIVPLGVLLLLHNHDALDLDRLAIDPTNTIFNTINPSRTLLQEPLFALTTSATTMSGLSYVGRAMDYAYALIIDDLNKSRHAVYKKSDNTSDLSPVDPDEWINLQIYIDREINKNKYRNALVVITLIVGLAVGITFAVLFLSSGGLGMAMWLTAIMAVLTMFSAFAGLGSRIGQVIDRLSAGINKAEHDVDTMDYSFAWGLLHLNHNYELAIIVSLVLSALPLVFLVLNAATANVLQILTLIVTAVVLVSALNSGAHYTGRTLDFLFGEVTLLSPLLWLASDQDSLDHSESFYERLFSANMFWKNCNNENIATVLGFIVAITVSVLVLSFGIWMPPFLMTLPFILQAPLFTMVMVSACCGIPARIGRWLDRRWETDETQPVTVLHWLFDKDPSPKKDGDYKRLSEQFNVANRSYELQPGQGSASPVGFEVSSTGSEVSTTHRATDGSIVDSKQTQCVLTKNSLQQPGLVKMPFVTNPCYQRNALLSAKVHDRAMVMDKPPSTAPSEASVIPRFAAAA